MFKKAKTRLSYRILKAMYFIDVLRFRRAMSSVRRTQLKILFDILNKNSGTLIGGKYGFFSIRNEEDFRRRVPLSSFEDYEPFVEAIVSGKQNVLTKEPVLILEPSSGSTSASKYVPYTRSLQKQFQRALSPWIYDLITAYPRIKGGTAYWSITPANKLTDISAGGIPIGFKDDSEYFGRFAGHWIRNLFTVPQEVSQIRDIASFRYVTLLFMLRDKNLRLISIWNPSFLTLLLEPVFEWKDTLTDDIESGNIKSGINVEPQLRRLLAAKLPPEPVRASELRNIFHKYQLFKGKNKNEGLLYKQIWPDLSLISCWADGNAALYMPKLKKLFPHAEIQPKGLIATEAIITIPLSGLQGGVLAVNSHFFEFIEQPPVSGAKTRLADELEAGKRYSVIVTTAGGLYRYLLQDCIEVIGYYKQCPVIKFIGKADNTVDICGEKLNEQFIAPILEELFIRHNIKPAFFIMAPGLHMADKSFSYVLYLQFYESGRSEVNILQRLAADIEIRLRNNFHYNYCRELRQLEPLRVFLISPESEPVSEFLQEKSIRGQRLGGIKPVVLDKGANWEEIFRGNFIDELINVRQD